MDSDGSMGKWGMYDATPSASGWGIGRNENGVAKATKKIAVALIQRR